MVFLLYNKPLLRVLVLLCGLGVATATWFYVGLSAQKLGADGVRDALAIVSFFIAGWLVMVIAEVVDNHYVRAFACLCVLLGGYIGFRWIFIVDGPELRELASGPSGMRLTGAGYWATVIMAVLMFALLVTRLILDKLHAGRRPVAAAPGVDHSLGARPEGMGEPAPEPQLAPIPLDTSPLAVESESQTMAPAARIVGPVSRLTGIGGMYLGTAFELTPGEHSVGRQDADLELAGDNQVSRRHASLSVTEAGVVTLADTGSTNGIFVNNQRIQSIELASGDTVRIGTSLFKVEA